MKNFLKLFINSKKGKLFLALFAVILLIVLIWAAKSGHLGTLAEEVYPQGISGYISDRESNPLAGVIITDTISKRSTVSVSDGLYTLTLPVENAMIRYEKDGTIFNPGFSDVPAGYWAAKWIGALKASNIVQGYSNGSFHPTEEVTRAQMAVFIARALAGSDAKVTSTGRQDYPDIPTSYWAYRYIDYLYNNTTIRGYSDGFHPEEKVTRAQMAVFISKALNIAPAEKIDPTFPDVALNYWAYGYIEKLYLLGIVSGYPDGKFLPEQIVTRDQMCVFIGRAFQSIPLTNGGYSAVIENFSLLANQITQFNVSLAPTGQFGTVKGKVKDSAGVGAGKANVVLTLEPALHESYETVTADDGSFSIYNIPAGPYPYYVSKEDGSSYKVDYTKQDWENVVYIETGEITNLDLNVIR